MIISLNYLIWDMIEKPIVLHSLSEIKMAIACSSHAGMYAQSGLTIQQEQKSLCMDCMSYIEVYLMAGVVQR